METEERSEAKVLPDLRASLPLVCQATTADRQTQARALHLQYLRKEGSLDTSETCLAHSRDVCSPPRVQDCPEKAERDAARPPRGSARPLQRQLLSHAEKTQRLISHCLSHSGRMLVLPLEPESHQAPHREHRERDLPHASEGTARTDFEGGHQRRWAGARRRPCAPHSRQSLRPRARRAAAAGPCPPPCADADKLQIAHYPTLLSVPADLAVPIVSEIEQYKSGLRACYASFGASLLSFEVGRLSGKGGHAHVQVSDIPHNSKSLNTCRGGICDKVAT